MVPEIIKWGKEKNFSLIKSEGTKENNKVFIKVMICKERECRFRLTFKYNAKEGLYQLDEKLAKKNKHSNFFHLFYLLILQITN